MTAISRILFAFLCAPLAVPAIGQELLQQIEAELAALVTTTRRQLVTVIVPQSVGTGPLRAVSVASGLALDDSLVVTAASVITGGAEVEVAPPDQSPRPASIVGVDGLAGIALLRTSGLILPPQNVASQVGPVELGNLVFLVTSAFEERAGYSVGVVTSLRPAGVNGQVTTEIESSAAAVPGSAGSVLVDTGGRVAGLVVGRTGEPDGAGAHGDGGVLAVPLSEVLSIVSQLREHPQIRRNWLGVSVQEMTPALREILGVTEGTGVIVIAVDEGSPALNAGLELGDVILACGGRLVREAGELMTAVARAPAGGRLRLEILRNGETLKIPVTLAELTARQASTDGFKQTSSDDRIRAMEAEIARLRATLEQTRR
jgi:S1-C subfamily serine protease